VAAQPCGRKLLWQPRGDDGSERPVLKPDAQLRPGVYQGLRAVRHRVPTQGGERHREELPAPHLAAPGE
jgi:hypothetical protein